MGITRYCSLSSKKQRIPCATLSTCVTPAAAIPSAFAAASCEPMNSPGSTAQSSGSGVASTTKNSPDAADSHTVPPDADSMTTRPSAVRTRVSTGFRCAAAASAIDPRNAMTCCQSSGHKQGRWPPCTLR
eukprot:Amastigsp_a679457_38.p4 type:complete len:130 gc:universal Amastigsp_a679457_38:399-10(-)